MPTTPDYIPVDNIEFGVRDEFPVTFDALLDTPMFGPAGLQRRKSLVMARVYGHDLDPAEIDLLDIRVQTYLSKMIARTMIGPGIDYWANQVISQSAGTTEQVSYDVQRVMALKEADKRLAGEIADLLGEVEAILPPVKLVAGTSPHVGDAGNLETTTPGTLYTPNPFDLPPVYGPPDTLGTTGA
jgi:hypothetical protein